LRLGDQINSCVSKKLGGIRVQFLSELHQDSSRSIF
jgi:hypothetical protein